MFAHLRIKVLAILLFTLFTLIFPALTFAQTATPSATSSATIPQTSITPNPNLIGYTDYIFISLLHTTSCISAGFSIAGKPCFAFLPNQVQGYNNQSGGLLGFTTGVISMLYYTPPLGTNQYLAYVGNNLGLVKEAHAQTQIGGSGQGVINLVLRLWQISRNISYLVMVIVFVVIGLMVMFRHRLNPQTVVSVQMALPGLVLGLIFITFSYFFASLIVDMAFLGIWLVGAYFLPLEDGRITNAAGLILPNHNVLSIFSEFLNAPNKDQFTAAVAPIIDTIQGTAKTVLDGVLFFGGCQYGQQLTDPIAKGLSSSGALNPAMQGLAGAISLGGCFSAGGWAVANPGAAIGFVIFLAILFVMLVAMIRLLMKLLSNYISILFLTFTAPFQFLASSLPGQQGLATDWLRNMLCNALAFPGVFAAFYFAAYILGSNTQTSFRVVQGAEFGTQTVPLFGGLNQELIKFLVAFGTLIATPAIPDIICNAIGKVGRAGQMISQEIGAARGEGEKRMGQVTGGLGNIGSTAGGYLEARRVAKQRRTTTTS